MLLAMLIQVVEIHAVTSFRVKSSAVVSSAYDYAPLGQLLLFELVLCIQHSNHNRGICHAQFPIG